MICRKATVALPGANPSLPEHKIGIFVLFWHSETLFSGLSSTKSRFLCAFCLWNPHFRAFRAQKVGFCAFLAFGTPIFWLFEHKIGVFVRFLPSEPPFSGFSSTKSRFLCAFTLRNPCFRAFRAQNRHFCALLPFGTPVFWHFEHKIGVLCALDVGWCSSAG